MPRLRHLLGALLAWPSTVAAPALARPPASPASGAIAGTIAAPVPAHAVVWLDGPTLPRPGKPVAPLELASRGGRLEPYFSVVLVGQTVVFPQAGGLVHRYYSGSRAKTFDLGSHGRGAAPSVRLDRPGVVDVFCRYHEQTHADIAVMPSSLYAVPDASGRFVIAGVPAGRYALRAHSPEGGPVWLPVQVKAGENVTAAPMAFPRHDAPDEQNPPTTGRGERAHPPQFEIP